MLCSLLRLSCRKTLHLLVKDIILSAQQSFSPSPEVVGCRWRRGLMAAKLETVTVHYLSGTWAMSVWSLYADIFKQSQLFSL